MIPTASFSLCIVLAFGSLIDYNRGRLFFYRQKTNLAKTEVIQKKCAFTGKKYEKIYRKQSVL
jgi:hypothetical protein